MARRSGGGEPPKRAVSSGSVTIVPVATIQLVATSKQALQVKHLEQPPQFAKPKRIHPRRTVPLVLEGAEREFHSLSTRATMWAPQRLAGPAPAAPARLILLTNTELTQPSQQHSAGNVGEPSAALNKNVVFYSGNWYAAMSSNAGQSFQYVDPASAFAAFDPPNSHFCCDQVVNYIPSIDTFVWLLQYGPDSGDNIQRLAFATTADVVQGKWHLYDITTAILGVPGSFLDFPDLAVGANYLYVTTNIFFPNSNQAGSGVVRIPLAQIAQGPITAQRFVSTELFSFRVAQQCGTTAYFAAHQDTSTLAVFSWDEDQAAPVRAAVGVARWIGGNGYHSRTPDGNRWLDRADPRITGATLAGTELWFAWSVDSNSNQRPKPFVQIARIDSRNLTLIENINIFDVDSAIAYGALATNVDADVGISYMIGGGPRYPSHVVGILTGVRQNVVVAQSDRGPAPSPETGKGEWGDFLTVRPAFPDRRNFVATGYTLKGPANGSNQDATPRFVIFARTGAGGAGPTPPGGGGGAGGGGGGSGGGGTAGPGGTGPITDVTTLPIMDPATGDVIKQAAGMFAPQAPLAQAAVPAEELVTKPGVERWPVKTGTDPGVADVGKNIIAEQSLGPGIVVATVEELMSAKRPADMPNPNQGYAAYQDKRATPVETTIWRVDATITAMKLEADGDYHLVLQGASGETMIAEVATATARFVNGSPWLENMKAARQAIDDKFVSRLSPADFVRVLDKLVPRESISALPQAPPMARESFLPPIEGEPGAPQPFKTHLPPTRARVTGVGFFDRVHGQMGVSQANGIELHPILRIEWI